MAFTNNDFDKFLFAVLNNLALLLLITLFVYLYGLMTASKKSGTCSCWFSQNMFVFD
jgi:hypothetical protein